MAVLIQFITLVVPHRKIDAIPGLRAHLAAAYPNAWQDEHLWAMGSMSPPHELGAALERAGLTLRDNSTGETRWKDICVIDYHTGPTNPCDWLHINPSNKTVWLAGTMPGAIAQPAHTHETNPLFLPTGAPSPTPPQPAMGLPHAPMPPIAHAQSAPMHAPTPQAPTPMQHAPMPNAPIANAPSAEANALLQDILAGMNAPGAGTLMGNANFNASDERKWRMWRIGGLAFVLLHGVFFNAFEGFGFHLDYLLGFLMPGLIDILLVGLIAWQVYALMNPAHQRPQTAVYLVDHSGRSRELFGIIGGVVLAALFVPRITMNFAMGPMDGMGINPIGLFSQILGICSILVIVVRQTVVIDGEKQRATRFAWRPKMLAFNEIQGLGQFTQKVNGVVQSVHLALFFGKGLPWNLNKSSPADIPAAAGELIRRTGIPHRERK